MLLIKKVGIHTGKVLCGIVGKRRFKFDVWSNDVTFANKMESSGKPGMVHISDKTYAFLKDQYFVLDGEDVGGKFFLHKFDVYQNLFCSLLLVNEETNNEIC